ncbi:hypothetical protein AXF42_Ash003725 [Apostasia shenzhenica]|uniref:Uncharacterized protein n=1 Tax=Apostasia shenzhenica TaxID=1088818 RepID=A0A2I0AHS5_9ASPA|nr:hypothetical protein AXF42_Ash003725 [Apostasia shenzhenica]
MSWGGRLCSSCSGRPPEPSSTRYDRCLSSISSAGHVPVASAVLCRLVSPLSHGADAMAFKDTLKDWNWDAFSALFAWKRRESPAIGEAEGNTVFEVGASSFVNWREKWVLASQRALRHNASQCLNVDGFRSVLLPQDHEFLAFVSSLREKRSTNVYLMCLSEQITRQKGTRSPSFLTFSASEPFFFSFSFFRASWSSEVVLGEDRDEEEDVASKEFSGEEGLDGGGLFFVGSLERKLFVCWPLRARRGGRASPGL